MRMGTKNNPNTANELSVYEGRETLVRFSAGRFGSLITCARRLPESTAGMVHGEMRSI